MLRNFFKTAGRNILKYKAYSLINFIGLTCGLALALLILSYVRSELSYDIFMKSWIAFIVFNTQHPTAFNLPAHHRL